MFSNKLYCWKDGGKVSDFLWFLVHSFCDTLDFDDEGFVHWSLRSLVVDASVDPPVLHFDPDRNDDDDVKIPESVSSCFQMFTQSPNFRFLLTPQNKHVRSREMK